MLTNDEEQIPERFRNMKYGEIMKLPLPDRREYFLALKSAGLIDLPKIGPSYPFSNKIKMVLNSTVDILKLHMDSAFRAHMKDLRSLQRDERIKYYRNEIKAIDEAFSYYELTGIFDWQSDFEGKSVTLIILQ